MGSLRERAIVARKIFGRRWVKIAVWLWAGIAFYDTLVSQFFTERWAKKAPKMRELIAETSGWLSWWGWLLILAAIIAIACFEYAFRKTGPKQRPSRATTEFDGHVPNVRVADTPAVASLFADSDQDKLIPLLEAGKITAWARRGYGKPPLLKLPEGVWQNHYLLFLPKDGDGRINQTFIRKNNSTESTYFDVHLNRAQLERAWPHLWDSVSNDRIPCTELLKVAATTGWDFSSSTSKHLIDLQDAMAQGGADGALTIWGRDNKWSADDLVQQEVLVKIAPDHWKDHRVNLFGALETFGPNNLKTYSWSPTSKPFGRHVYVDLHVSRSQVGSWLPREALPFKGKTK